MKKLFTIIIASILLIANTQAADTLRLHLNSNPLYGGVKLRNLTTNADANATNNFTLNVAIGDFLRIMSSDADTQNVIFDSKPAGSGEYNYDCQGYCSVISSFQVAGDYVFHVSKNGVNLENADKITIVVGTTGINSYNNSIFSTAFPNPFKDNFTLTYSDGDVVNIYNILGKNIKTFNLNTSGTYTDIDLSEIPAGVYFYMILQEGVIVDTKKIVKQ